jgi:hypothetical protein
MKTLFAPSGETRMARKFLAVVALVAAPLCWPFAASANLLIDYKANGAPFFTLLCTAPSGSSCSVGPNAPLGGLGLEVTATAQSNAPGTPTAADLSLTSMTILNTSRTLTQTVEILVGDTGFLIQSPPPLALNLQSTIGLLVSAGSGGTLLCQLFRPLRAAVAGCLFPGHRGDGFDSSGGHGLVGAGATFF